MADFAPLRESFSLGLPQDLVSEAHFEFLVFDLLLILVRAVTRVKPVYLNLFA